MRPGPFGPGEEAGPQGPALRPVEHSATERRHERLRFGRRLDRAAAKDVEGLYALSVQVGVVVGVRPENTPREVDAGKQALRPRVRENFGLQLSIRASRSGPPNRSSSDRRVDAERD